MPRKSRFNTKRNWKLHLLLILEVSYLIASGRLAIPPVATVVPYLTERGWKLYEDIILQYPPGYMWLNIALAQLLPNLQLRMLVAQIVITLCLTSLLWRISADWFGKRAALVAAWVGGLGT